MPVAIGAIAQTATQILGSEAFNVVARKFGGAVYERIFSAKEEPQGGASLETLSVRLEQSPTREEMERAFEALESRILLVLDRKAASDRRALVVAGAALGALQLVMIALLLLR